MKKININSKAHKAAGILPIVEIDNNIYFILGKEKNGKYCDFGGHKNDNETYEETAIREFDEESMGVLYNKNKLKKIISKLPCHFNKKEKYITFLLKLKYDPNILKTYNTLIIRIFQCDNKKIIPYCKNGLLEKSEFKLFTANDILKNNNEQIRDKFLKTFTLLIKNLKK